MALCLKSVRSLAKHATPGGAPLPALRRTLSRWLSDESGAAAVEYSLLVAFISLAILGAITGVSGGISGVAKKLTTTLAGM
ncbi:MAG: Flp family type IVb pilin [Xanthobacteraceae bacterium]